MVGYAVSSASALPRMTVLGGELYAGDHPWHAWGMNWGVGDNEPVIEYFDNPTAANLAVLKTELRTARGLGANSMRIYLQLGQVMQTATSVRHRTLLALARLLALAQSDGVYLDITGDLVWRPDRAPRWYAQMPWPQRWKVQATFWRAVAHTASKYASVLCYELTSEPIVSQTPGYYYGQSDNWWFVQSIATSPAARADAIAREWTRLLANAVRSQDDRPITIGLLPLTSGPFAPANVAPLLDMLVIHEYPTTGETSQALSIVQDFSSFHLPVLLGETFMLDDDAATQQAFLTQSAPYLTGTFEFFDGRDPRTMPVQSIGDAVYKVGLDQFMALRRTLLTTYGAGER
jgi:hypothetical protein